MVWGAGGREGVVMTLKLAMHQGEPHQRKEELRFIELKCPMFSC